MKKPVSCATRLFLLTLLAACGDAAPPAEKSAEQDPAASARPAPDDVLAALPPETRPYGLDVYTARCLGCHGDVGQGSDEAPALRGLSRAVMQDTLHDYRAGKPFGAQTATMAQAVAALSDAEIAAVSIYAGE